MCNGVERVKDPRTTQCVMEWNVLKIHEHSMCNGVERVKDQQNNTDDMFRKQKENKIEGCTKYRDIKGALYRIQILCRRYTFWSYPAG